MPSILTRRAVVVIWELRAAGEDRRRAALRLIAFAFAVLAAYLAVQSTWVITAGFPGPP